jgi:hypothetical protein
MLDRWAAQDTGLDEDEAIELATREGAVDRVAGANPKSTRTTAHGWRADVAFMTLDSATLATVARVGSM